MVKKINTNNKVYLSAENESTQAFTQSQFLALFPSYKSLTEAKYSKISFGDHVWLDKKFDLCIEQEGEKDWIIFSNYEQMLEAGMLANSFVGKKSNLQIITLLAVLYDNFEPTETDSSSA